MTYNYNFPILCSAPKPPFVSEGSILFPLLWGKCVRLPMYSVIY